LTSIALFSYISETLKHSTIVYSYRTVTKPMINIEWPYSTVLHRQTHYSQWLEKAEHQRS